MPFFVANFTLFLLCQTKIKNQEVVNLFSQEHLHYENEKRGAESLLFKQIEIRESFPIEQLDELAVRQIMKYLNFDDKKNLRLVSIKMEQLVSSIDKGFQRWKFHLSNDNYENVIKFLAETQAKEREET